MEKICKWKWCLVVIAALAVVLFLWLPGGEAQDVGEINNSADTEKPDWASEAYTIGAEEFHEDLQDTSAIKVGAICYHKFYTAEEEKNGVEFGTYTIWAEEFENHLRYLEEQKIRVITAGELLDYLDGKLDLPEKCMMLTVDDCDISFYRYAYPLLREFGVTANAAIIGNRTDGAQEGGAYRKSYCTWDEIKEMADSGYVEFGAHTYYLHDKENGRTGTMLKSDESIKTYRSVLITDLASLNQKIEECVGYQPRFFVYPYYAVSMPSIPILRDDLGYELLFCGNSDSTYRYCGESVHMTNYNIFTKGEKPADIMIKRYTPRAGDDFEALVQTIFEES